MWDTIRRIFDRRRPAEVSDADASKLKANIRREVGPELKIFVSHRWGLDRDLYDFVSVFEGRVSGVGIRNLSIPAEKRITNVHGRDVTTIKLKAEISKLMAEADVIVTSSVAMRNVSDWVMWELELAAFGLSKPILFVDHRENLQLPTRLISDFRGFGVEVYRAQRDKNGGVNFAQAFAQILENSSRRPPPDNPIEDGDEPEGPSPPLH